MKYTKEYQSLLTATNEAQWISNIQIVEGDGPNSKKAKETGEASAALPAVSV